MTTIDPKQSYTGLNSVNENYTTQTTTPTKDADNLKTAPKGETTGEDELLETNFDSEEDFDLTPESAKEQVKTALSEKEEAYDNQVREYYLQIDQLRSQLKTISDQRHSLIQKVAAGSSISEVQSEMTELDNQTKTINSNIDTLFLSILALEDELENVRLNANNAINEINALVGTTSTGNTGEANAVSKTNNANQTTPFTGKRTTSNPTATKLADNVIASINANGSTTGWCLRGVNRALQKTYGFSFSYYSAYQALGELQSRSEFEEITNQYPSKNDLKNLPAGAIVVWGQNDAHPHGHISIALGDGREASDHIANQYTNSGGGYHIFMPKDLS